MSDYYLCYFKNPVGTADQTVSNSMIINESLNEKEAACCILLGTVRGIPQSLWLQAQLQLASLDRCHKWGSVREVVCA